jgi:hypothetical protein
VGEHAACLSLAERQRLQAWLEHPNGSLCLSLVTFESVEGGGVMVRTAGYGEAPPPSLLFPAPALNGGYWLALLADAPDDPRFSASRRIVWRCLDEYARKDEARACAMAELARREASRER